MSWIYFYFLTSKTIPYADVHIWLPPTSAFVKPFIANVLYFYVWSVFQKNLDLNKLRLTPQCLQKQFEVDHVRWWHILIYSCLFLAVKNAKLWQLPLPCNYETGMNGADPNDQTLTPIWPLLTKSNQKPKPVTKMRLLIAFDVGRFRINVQIYIVKLNAMFIKDYFEKVGQAI